MKITGNTVLITGGTSGIGRILAEELHDRGNRVVVTGRRRLLLEEISAARPGLVGFEMDVDDPKSIAGVAARVQGRFPDLNVLVANAGASVPEDVTSGWDISTAEKLIDTNILGVMRTIAAFLPMLTCRPDGVIMVTGSKLAFVPRAEFPTYCATKAFLHSWLQSLRHQLRRIPVEVLELLPPYVATELTGAGQARDARAMPLRAFADEVFQLLAAGDHAQGEILVERARPDRWAERGGRYEATFAAANPD